MTAAPNLDELIARTRALPPALRDRVVREWSDAVQRAERSAPEATRPASRGLGRRYLDERGP